ncbi:IS5 family transposase [Burkholderia cenocepacia]|uniref:IS5 family transposase n=1 Tax=Burkholderia cenocepacia TaxID=95486 RepID=A0ABD4UI82_9BURK|nr:IS5 family transposase [Burkholderia cenocepacia]MCW3662522.1 IS5 family transposase [Burkholderia cenocepacia]MCW3697928.1 IS5 family transposase [Burkholderia cenocepacia]MCW3705649.1 IS5 family transposase [Burkholderia cenocepacia]MCW3714020.1 IS5 family transposase [Burkholderia cenocepacia]MCW3722088.1 IS5 family transposase [Burkholderia cenocepacia]
MGPKPSQPESGELFRPRLDEQINMKHPLVKLAALIDWPEIERTFAVSFTSARGRPALPPRLIAGLLYLQHTFDASDEAVVNTWVENPYWQFFCGETYLQTERPIDPSSLTRWRKRIGEEGVETLLAASIDAARRGGVIQKASAQQVIVDTTVMPKAVAYPTDSRLLERSRQHLVKAVEDNGLRLRQNYNRVAPRLAAQIGRYAHAKQFKRMKKALRTLRTRVGRVHREVSRQLQVLPEAAKAKVQDLLQRTGRILTQRMKDKNKLYALHAPEVECISKGKTRTPYEFGVKVSIATTLKEGLVVGMRSMPGNPYDGHTLAETLEQVGILTGTDRPPATAIVDKDYKGVKLEGVRILMSGQKRGITRTLKALIKRRSAIEPAIGHMKMDGRLARNPLKGALGDALHAVMCGAGHNLRLILAALRLYCARFGLSMQGFIAALLVAPGNRKPACG